MKNAFVTGGSGFIGRSLIRQLKSRQVHVKALARSEQAVQKLVAMGAEPIRGDLSDRSLLWQEMQGIDVVFHLAGWYKLGSGEWREAELINVGGTRSVLEAACDAGVPKIVYISTLAVFGDTRGQLPDETYAGSGHFTSHYDRTKWLAHYDVVLPLMSRGVPIVIAMPGLAYGPDDHSPLGDLMKRFLQSRLPFPFLPGPETIMTYAHVDDIATGLLLAAEKGQVGESYILAGPPVSLGEMVDFWARLTGKAAPIFHLPTRLIQPFIPLIEKIEPYFDLPPLFSSEVIKTLGITQMGSSFKAENELGWRQRPLRSGILETFGHLSHQIADEPRPVTRDRETATLALAAAGALFFIYLLYRRWRRRR